MKLGTLAFAELTVVKGIPVEVISISREEYNKMWLDKKKSNLIHIELELDNAISVNIQGPASK